MKRPDDPLAERMRPCSLDEIVGLDTLIGEQGLLSKAIASDQLPSMILWGPPGSGKTTLARCIAATQSSHFVPFSAVTAGIKEVRRIMQEATVMRREEGLGTLLFVDEIHRFNRAQQDAFLPFVERGDIALVGATTENPSLSLNGSLLSRVRLVLLPPLSEESIRLLIDRALQDEARGLGKRRLTIDDKAADYLVAFASGDARRALTLLDQAAKEAREGAILSRELVERTAQRRILVHDKAGDNHYDLISALHKAIRNSDPQAAIYWLARILEAGEDPLFVARRLIRCASEDVGLADPEALQLAISAREAVKAIGMPEASLALTEAALHLATAPKSNAIYLAYKRAAKTVREKPAYPVPTHLRNAVTKEMKAAGYGKGYAYAHDDPRGVSEMECLPGELRGSLFYEPVERGFEREIRKRIAYFEKVRNAGRKKS